MKDIIYNIFADTWNSLSSTQDCYNYQIMLSEILGSHINEIPQNTKNENDQLEVYLKNAEILAADFEKAAGHSVGNVARTLGVGPEISYEEILKKSGQNLKVKGFDDLTVGRSWPIKKIEKHERLIAENFLDKIWSNLPDEKKEALKLEMYEAVSKKGKEELAKKILQAGSPFILLLGAKASGFAIYTGATTGLSLLAGALGLNISFGIYIGLSRAISLALGPIGWILTGIWAVYKFGSPNYNKKILPSILLFFTMRQHSKKS